MSVEPQKVLVTRNRIDNAAVEMLKAKNLVCVFSPPDRSVEEIAELAKREKVCAIMVSQGKITRDVVAASDQLQVIAKHGSGVNNINLSAAEEMGIPVYRAVGANARAVAEHAIALMLALRKSLPRLDAATKQGDWLKGSFVGHDIEGTRLGLLGLGVIGREVARLAKALGMEVAAYDPALSASQDTGLKIYSDPHDMARNVDIVSLHCPLIPATRHIVDSEFLRCMGSEAVLVNTARGGVVDETALSHALSEGIIAGAGIDSFETEPPDSDAPLFGAPNLIVTPHAAGLTPGAERSMATMAADFIINHLEGKEIPTEFCAHAANLGGLSE